jgi:hypothetical protein
MAISYRGVSNAAGQANGTTTTSGTAIVTPTLPSGAASGDRIFIISCGSNDANPLDGTWTVITLNAVVGSGTLAAGSGQRRISAWYKDYDGVWSMPSVTLTFTTQNSHWAGAIAITPTAGSSFDTPTASPVATTFNTASTSYTSPSSTALTTHTGGFLIAGTCNNDNVTASSPTISQTGSTIGAITERADGGTATGNDIAGKIHTASVTTGGGTANVVVGMTLSAASQGATLVIEQTESAAVTATGKFFAMF